jgi:uncharacterized protein (DUF952 family)
LKRIYKLLDRPAWNAALALGVFRGSAVDEADGFIHFSDATQAQETARRHFTDSPDLLLLTVDAESLGDALRWEPSRDGALFPHLYAALPVASVIEMRALEPSADGVPRLGTLEP